MAKKLDGKQMAAVIVEEVKQEVTKILNDKEGRAPHCAVLLVGDNQASKAYVASKEKMFKKVGMTSSVYRIEADVTQEQLQEVVDNLNQDEEVDGILVQLPLPKHLNAKPIIESVDPTKDVDGLTIENQGYLLRDEGLKPCTPLGVVELLKRYDIPIAGKNCVVIGRSDLVGRPAAMLMLKENATITITHSGTENLKEHTQTADILIVAMGNAGYIDESYIKEDAVVVDVGIHRVDGKIVGDVTQDVFDKSSYYTPVPGGVGPMTIAMLMSNTLLAYQRRVNATQSL